MAFWTLFRFHDQVLARADVLKQNAGLIPSTSTADKAITSTNDGGSDGGESLSSLPHDLTTPQPLLFEPYIAIHIRGERHEGEDNWRKFLVCAQQLQSAIQQRQIVPTMHDDDDKDDQRHRNLAAAVAAVPPPPRLIFVADDSYHGTRQEIKMTLQSWDPAFVRVAPIEVYHVDHPSAVQNAQQANIDVYAELAVLLDAECLVHSHSGFSELSHQITISNLET